MMLILMMGGGVTFNPQRLGRFVFLAVRELCGRGAVGLSGSTAGLFEAYTLLLSGHPSLSPVTFELTIYHALSYHT